MAGVVVHPNDHLSHLSLPPLNPRDATITK